MAGLELADLFERRLRSRDAKVSEIVINGEVIDLARDRRVLKQGLKLGTKHEVAVRLM